MNARTEKRVTIIEAITAPLGFFVLALLIVETFLAAVLIGTNLEKAEKMTGVYLGVALFIFVTVLVFFLDWFKPENLTFDKESHLRAKGKPPFGTESHPSVDRDSMLPTGPTNPGKS